MKTIGKNKWIVLTIILLSCLALYCRFAISTLTFSPQEKICDNLTKAGLFDQNDCMLEGRAYQYIPRYFKKGEVDIEYVRTAMTGFPLLDEFSSDNGTYLKYGLSRSIFGIHIVVVSFDFDREDVLIDYGISE